MRYRLGLLALAGMLLAGCQTTPGAPVIRLAAAMESEPLSVAAPVSDNPAEGLSENDWGGEVPQPKPAGDVGDAGLGDIG